MWILGLHGIRTFTICSNKQIGEIKYGTAFTGKRVSAERWKILLFCFFLYTLQLKSKLELSFFDIFAYLMVLRQYQIVIV